MSKEHIPDSELNTDPFLTYIGKILDYYKSNKLTVQWIATGIIAVFIVLVIINQYQTTRKRNAQRAYDNAMTLVAINEFINTYKGNVHYPQALYKKGNMLFRDGDFKGAAEAYSEVVKKYPKNGIAQMSMLCLANSYRAMKDYTSAQKYYNELLKKKNSPIESECKLELARCYVNMGDYQAADELVEKFIVDEPNSFLVTEAKKLSATIQNNM